MRALAELGEPIESLDSLLIFWIIEKFDGESRKQWQVANQRTHFLKWKDLAKLVDTRQKSDFRKNPVESKAHSIIHCRECLW